MSHWMYSRFLWLSWMKIPSAPADVHGRKWQRSGVCACVYLLAPCRAAHDASFHSLKGAVVNSTIYCFVVYAIYAKQYVKPALKSSDESSLHFSVLSLEYPSFAWFTLHTCRVWSVCLIRQVLWRLSFTTPWTISNTHLNGGNSQYIVMATTLLVLTTASPPTKVPQQPSPGNPLPLLSFSI